MKYSLIFLIVPSLVWVQAQDAEPGQDRIQLALLLDTSSSMDGLIHQAQTQLWSVVNDMALARKQGRIPQLEVALFEYGKSTLAPEEGYLRMVSSFTRDLDLISERLFELTTNGGDEYCGWVIKKALEDLKWSDDAGDYKSIFIAGNEPFDQGKVDFRAVCSQVIAKGVTVNTIFCGNRQEGENTHWKEGAELADGRFMVIDQNQLIQAPTAPQDTRILELSQALNATYVPYGGKGKMAKERQVAQDEMAAASAPSAAVQRAVAKSSSHYRAENWDLVDALESGAVDLETMASEDLPEVMVSMDDEARQAYLKEQAETREKIQKQLQDLKAQREDYLQEYRKHMPQDSLDQVMKQAIREQARTRAFTFEKR